MSAFTAGKQLSGLLLLKTYQHILTDLIWEFDHTAVVWNNTDKKKSKWEMIFLSAV